MKRNKIVPASKEISVSSSSGNPGFFSVDFSGYREDTFKLTVAKNIRADILMKGPFSLEKTEMVIEEGAEVKLQFEIQSLRDNWVFHADLGPGAALDLLAVDLYPGKYRALIEVDLNGEGSRLNWRIASLSGHQSDKLYTINFIHNARHTEAVMDNFGICEDHSSLIFSGRSHINNGCSFSKTRQNSKVIVFDEHCVGRADPVLGIDENEVEAGHAAVVGKINEEQLYYLQTRGLSEKQSKILIKRGYMLSVIDSFTDQTEKERLLESLSEVE